METQALEEGRPLLLDPKRDRRIEPVARAVLVVEDDPAQREALSEMLLGWGYEPLPVGSAEEAMFAVRGREMDAALVDIFLPGRSGVALFSKLRERFPSAMLVGMSALDDVTMARRCKGLGADLFLGKPVDPEALGQILQTEHQSRWH